jgi:phage baseplate assembly protein W
MSSFSFKSTGVKVSDRSLSTDKITKKTVDIGIKTPLSNFQGRQIFDMHTDFRDQIKDNLRNLIMTNRGERLGLYNFGADLSALLFDFVSLDNIESEIVSRIENSVENFMQGIVIDEITAVELDKNEKDEVNRDGMVKIRLRIIYSIPSVRVNNQALEVTLQNAG